MRHNQYGQQPVTSATPAGDEFTRLMWCGYEDFRAGRPYAADFDKWQVRDQINYEAGRRAAACLKPYMPGKRLPRWPEDADFNSIVPADIPQVAVDVFLAENALTERKRVLP